MPNCYEYQEMISRLLDEELGADEAQTLHAHIAECDECRRLYDAFSAMSGAFAGDMEDPPEELAAGIMFKVRSAAAAPKKKRFRIGHYAALAACLAVVILAASRSDLLHGGMHKAVPLAPETAVDMQSKTSFDGAPIPMPEEAEVMDILLDAEYEVYAEDDSAFGYSDFIEYSADSTNGAVNEMDGGAACEPEAPDTPESFTGSEPQEMPYSPLLEVLSYKGVRYEWIKNVDQLPVGAVYVSTAHALFGAAFAEDDPAVYTLDDALYICTGTQQYALYQK